MYNKVDDFDLLKNFIYCKCHTYMAKDFKIFKNLTRGFSNHIKTVF